MSSSDIKIPSSIKYDWITLKRVCNDSYINAAKVMLMLYVPGTEFGKAIRHMGEAYVNQPKHCINFISNGVKTLKIIKEAKVEHRFLGQYLEFAAHRDLLEFNKTGQIKLRKNLVLDLLDAGKLSRDNPLACIRGEFIVFPVEHMH